jgi:acyl-CoA synthetase (NDP forming)
LEQAGVIVAEDIFEFENFVKNLCFLKDKRIRGNRVGLISNAGFECVAMSDNLKNDRELKLAVFSPQTIQRVTQLLRPLGIDRLQDIRNPIDITPVADDRTFCEVVDAVLNDENVDCAVVSPLPMSPALQTLAPSAHHKEDLNRDGSTGRLLTEIFHKTKKPMVVSIDSGEIYQPLVDLLEDGGIPTFRHSDDAIRFMRKYISVRKTKNT